MWDSGDEDEDERPDEQQQQDEQPSMVGRIHIPRPSFTTSPTHTSSGSNGERPPQAWPSQPGPSYTPGLAPVVWFTGGKLGGAQSVFSFLSFIYKHKQHKWYKTQRIQTVKVKR